MKKVFFAILMAGSLPVMAQKMKAAQVPEPTQKSFAKSYPGTTDVKWEKENGNFEANFMQGNQKVSVLYNEKGEVLETEYPMESNRMPANMTKYIADNYPGKSVKEVSRVAKPHQPMSYEVIVADKELTFGPNGQFMKEAAAH